VDRRPRGIRVRSGRIQIDFQYQGIRCREMLPLRPTPSNLRLAAQKREAVLYAIATRNFNCLEHFPGSELGRRLFRNASQVTVAELLEAFLRTRQQSTERSTWKNYRSAVKHHLLPQFGKKVVSDLKTSDIRSWRAELGISAKRINNVLIPLRGALEDAYRDGLIPENPASRIESLKHRYDEPDPFSVAEIRSILEHAEGQVRNLFQFAFWTGLRTSELIALRWGDVDFDAVLVRVRRASVGKVTKGPKTAAGERDVKLLPPAADALKAQQPFSKERGVEVFLNPRTVLPWSEDGQIRKTAWAPTLKRAGVRYRYPYQTRHTYASLMLSAGENPMWVAQQMGHRDWGMIRQRYGRWLPTIEHSAGAKASALWSQPGHDDHARG
jgi:integrase